MADLVPDGEGVMPTKVLALDLATTSADVPVGDGYAHAFVLCTWRDQPLGQVRVPTTGGRLAIESLREAAFEACRTRLASAIVTERLGLTLPEPCGPLPSTSVIVCTRDRPDDLRRCLTHLQAARPADVEVIVVDNAPRDWRTKSVVRASGARYVCEPRQGLGWARMCGAHAACGEVLLYTDDDVVVTKGWVDAMRRPLRDPSVAAVTGLVVPWELETEAQELFERHVGFSRGFERREFSALTIAPLAAGSVGAGASLAFRRDLVRSLGLFAVELGAGTIARAAEDTWALYRLLRVGFRIVYTPEAWVWHQHRRENDALLSQLRGYATGTVCFALRALIEDREGDALQTLWWLLRHHLTPRLWHGIRRRPGSVPVSLTLAEWRGALTGPGAYVVSRWRERHVRRTNGTTTPVHSATVPPSLTEA